MLVERQKFPSPLGIFLHFCLEEWPLALHGWVLSSIQLKIDIKKIQWWGQAHGDLKHVSCLCTNIFFLEQWIIHPSDLLSALEPCGQKQPGLIISCIFDPFYSWKVYMENKNNMFSCHSTGSAQGSDARNKKLKLKKTSWISEHMQKEGLCSGCPCSATSIWTSVRSGIGIEHLWHAKRCSDHYGQR